MALALRTWRSTVAAVASSLAALALAAAITGHTCRVESTGPEVTMRELIEAAKAGDRDAIFSLLTPATRARLEVEARRATDLVGAAVRYTAKDLISIGTSDGSAPTDITVIEQRGDRATVEIVSPTGRARVELVKTEGRWRVELPAFGGM